MTIRIAETLLANRLVYGKRATPYEVMADFGHRMAGTLDVDRALPDLAEAARTGVRASAARVRLFLPDGKVSADATLDAGSAVANARFDPDVEACAYFVCLQALENVTRHAGNAPTVVRLEVG